MKRPGSEHRSHITLFSLVNLWKLSVLPPTIKSGATKLRIAAGILAITEAANQSAEEFRKSGVQITSERYPKIRRLCGVHETQNLILTSSEDYFSFILIVRIYLHLSIEFQDHLAPRRLECTSGAFGGSVSTDGMFGSDQIARHPTDAESGAESWAVIFSRTKPQMFHWVDRKENWWSIPSRCVFAAAVLRRCIWKKCCPCAVSQNNGSFSRDKTYLLEHHVAS